MPLIAQKIPKIGLVMEDVMVIRWLKNVGERINAGEILLEVESEKSVVEIEAVATGQLTEILVQVDQSVTVGHKVAWIESAEEQRPNGMHMQVADVETLAVPASSTLKVTPSKASDAPASERLLSTPVARKVAREHGLDLREIAGTGPGGRIQLKDVEDAALSHAGATSGTPQPLSAMRRALARAMTLSNATVPQFTVERSVDWTAINIMRKESAKLPAESVRLSVNDFLLQAAARALMEFPGLNSTFAGDLESNARVIPAIGAHIGLVVAIDNGLLVPVLHHVEQMGLADIASYRAACVGRSMNGRLSSDDLIGATFSISNLGAQGPDRFTAIINPPQSAILAVGRQRDCVVVVEGSVAVRSMSELTMTVDHRVADGRQASQFLGCMVAILESQDWRL